MHQSLTILTFALALSLGATSTRAQAVGPKFKVLAFATSTSDQGHLSYEHEANRWFPKMAALHNFTYDSTKNWADCNLANLSKYQVVIFLDTRPTVQAQREAFKQYMDNGGAWIGCHFAGFALNQSQVPQNWDWYHNQFLGSGEYLSNTWAPTSAILRVEDSSHAFTQGVPITFKASPNEWYRWKNDLKKQPDIKILLSIDPTSFPLGTGPKPEEIWHSGYYPVAWTNTKYKMLYVNMGHNDVDYSTNPNKDLSQTFGSESQNKFLLNAMSSMAGVTPVNLARPAKSGLSKSSQPAQAFQLHIYDLRGRWLP